MTGMQFGIHFQLSCAADQSPLERYRETIEQAVAAEALGFESVWPVEQHFDAGSSILPAPMLLLAALSARTTTLRLGSAVTLLPLAHPIRVAEEVATLDMLSGGRAECGVGRGQDPAHFAGLGVSQAESSARFAEGIEILRRALTEAHFTHDGEFHQLSDVAVVPRPLHQLRIRIAANSAESFALAGCLGLPIIAATHVNPVDRLSALLGVYRQVRRDAGHADGSDDVTLLAPTYTGVTRVDTRADLAPAIARIVELATTKIDRGLSKVPAGPDGDAARIRLLELRATFERLSIDEMARSGAVFGTPDECTEALCRLRDDLGADRVICWFEPGGVIPHDRVLRAMKLFSRDVMPSLARRSLAA
jgi:alkanesulfonate monooxygenase SsuD/methylene tetrahydromethanopterin reductase-like flavin-dependent oxidoreductase (luciferase family)